MKTIHIIHLILLIVINAGCHKTVDRQKPNILFIAIDDLRPELGAYGNELIKSPNLDKLASQGRLFTRHFVSVPTCGASRYSMLSGRRPYNRQQLSNQAIVTELSENQGRHDPESFAHQLRKNGYYTVALGKIGHYPDGLVYPYEGLPSDTLEMPFSWDEISGVSDQWGTAWNAFFGYAHGKSRTVEKRKVLPYEAANVPDEGYPDGLTAKKAVEKLDELAKKGQPFLFAVGFYKPHLPFTAPKKYWDLYDTARVSLSPNPYLPENVPMESFHTNGEIKGYQLGPKPMIGEKLRDSDAKTLIQGYYASISYVDAQVGKVLEKLESTGLAENTVVIIWGDHGWHLGDQTVWGKHTVFERSLKSTLIIKIPGMAAPGNLSRSIVESIDLYPTIMDLTDTPIPDSLDGLSLVPTLLDPDANIKQAAYGYFRNGISMRNDRYRFTVYNRSTGVTHELYDHDVDPNETKNIADEMPEVIQTLLPIWKIGNTGLFMK